MKKKLPTDSPHDDWTLEQLGQFAQQIAKRTAHDAWLLGRAYTIAKAKAKAEGKKIETWHKEWLPFVSQPTLSRYEAVSKLAEEEVMGKGLTEVYRLIGIVAKKTSPDEEHTPTNLPPGGESQQKTSPAEAEESLADPGPEGKPQQATALKVLPAEPTAEPDLLLERLAPVVGLLTSIVRDLPSLDTTLDATPAINDAVGLLEQVRAGLENTAAA